MTVLHLRSLPFEDIVQSFYQLKAPAELDGEYAAGLLVRARPSLLRKGCPGVGWSPRVLAAV
jgi:hypothetical protein